MLEGNLFDKNIPQVYVHVRGSDNIQQSALIEMSLQYLRFEKEKKLNFLAYRHFSNS